MLDFLLIKDLHYIAKHYYGFPEDMRKEVDQKAQEMIFTNDMKRNDLYTTIYEAFKVHYGMVQ